MARIHAKALFWGGQAAGVAIIAAGLVWFMLSRSPAQPPAAAPVPSPPVEATPLALKLERHVKARVKVQPVAPEHHHWHHHSCHRVAGHCAPETSAPAPTTPQRLASASITTSSNVPIVYRKPTSLPWGRPSYFAAEIASADLSKARQELAAYPGAEQLDQIPYFSTVRMQLWGPPGQVQIDAEDPAEQDVSKSANARWRWAVQPKAAGPITLTLSVFDTVGGKEHDGPAYTDTFTVNKPAAVVIQEQVTDWNPVWLAVTGGLTLVSAWVFGAWRRFFPSADSTRQARRNGRASKRPRTPARGSRT